MARRQRRTTWLELAVRNGGLRHGVRAMTWALSWGLARESVGHDPSVDEVADYWKSSRRTAFRDQASFRKAFPDFETPAPIFASEEAAQRIRALAARADELEASIKGGSRRLDTAVMELGLLGPA